MRVLQKKSFQNAVEAARAKTPLKNSAFSQSKKCQSFNNLTSHNVSALRLSSFGSASRAQETSSLEFKTNQFSPFTSKDKDTLDSSQMKKSQFYNQTSFMLREDQSAFKESEDFTADSGDGTDQFASPLLREPKKVMTRQQFHQYYVQKHGQPPQLGDQTYVKEYIEKLIDCIQYNHNILQDDYSNNIQQKLNPLLPRLVKKSQSDEVPPKFIGQKKIQKKQQTFIKEEQPWTYKVVFVRHGQSIWNKSGKFSGWVDVPLNETGVKEARKAGRDLKEAGFHFDESHTSMLDRAHKTNSLVLEEMDLLDHTEIKKSWRINERHYGSLQGLCKKETAKIYGDDQVKQWRQSFDNPPPFVDYNDPEHPRFNELYSELDENQHKAMPKGESLKMVINRVAPYWNEEIVQSLQNLKKSGSSCTLLYTAHEHVLRGMVKYLTGIDNEQVLSLRIPNAAPFIFEFDSNMKVLRNYYLDNEDVSVVDSVKKESKDIQFMTK